MDKFKKIFFVGVGGIGVSALAHYFSDRGSEIFGSDLEIGDRNLLPKGTYWETHDQNNIADDIDLLIYSPAVPEDNPERKKAAELGIKQYSYPEALGIISHSYTTIAITGTHGKSTTTALLGEFFETAGFDPTVIVGAVVPRWKSNYRNGKSNVFIVEACEYRAHMLNITPKTIVLTNLEHDHPDFYRDIGHTQEVFASYIEKLHPDDLLIVNGDDIHLSAILHRTKADVIRYGMSGALLDLRASIKEKGESGQEISLIWRGQTIGSFHTSLPGKHNVMNILAAAATLIAYRGSTQSIGEVLKEFPGVGRRFEILGTDSSGHTIVSDYAHHPTALRAVIDAANERFPGKRILVVFRPHHQERTKKLFNEFTDVLRKCDHMILLEIYDVAGRGSSEPISSNDLVSKVLSFNEKQDIRYASNFDEARNMVSGRKGDFDVILVVGAGDADKLARELSQQ